MSNTSPSKRWTTTSSSALAETASKVGTMDRGKMQKDLYDRKISNTKTSISFGNAIVDYTSDQTENQRKIFQTAGADSRATSIARAKAMKAELTQTSFTLGDTIPEYLSTSHESMNAANTFKNAAKVSMNTDLKEAVKRSSVHFGNESVAYLSTAHQAMKYEGNSTDFSKSKQDVMAMTAQLRKHNFSFGEEKTLYETDYNRGYGTVDLSAYRNDKKGERKAAKEEARKCHFSLGNDQILYETNTQRALMVKDGFALGGEGSDRERAKEMKAALQRTSICIGDDREYM